jgi:hypothetical protein
LILFCVLRLLDYLALHSFDIERTLWMLYQKRAVRTKLYIYVCISISRIIYNQNESLVLHNSTIWWKTKLKQREKKNYSIDGVNNSIVKKKLFTPTMLYFVLLLNCLLWQCCSFFLLLNCLLRQCCILFYYWIVYSDNAVVFFTIELFTLTML